MKACILFSTHPIFILHIEVADFEHFILTVGKKFSTESSLLFKIGSFWTQDTEQVASPVVGNNSETQSFTYFIEGRFPSRYKWNFSLKEVLQQGFGMLYYIRRVIFVLVTLFI